MAKKWIVWLVFAVLLSHSCSIGQIEKPTQQEIKHSGT